MAFKALTAEEQQIVLRCMKATVAHIEDWEKHSRLGLEPQELNRIISEWPDIEDADENGIGFLAINNCMNEVCHGFRIAPQDWHTWFETNSSTAINRHIESSVLYSAIKCFVGWCSSSAE